MKHIITFAPEAGIDYRALSAYHRAAVREVINSCLRFEPERESKSRIKRLRGLQKPQYRLRVGEMRVFYDLSPRGVEVLGIVKKQDAADWLNRMGVPL